MYFDTDKVASGVFAVDVTTPSRVLFKGEVRLSFTAEPGIVLVRIGADDFQSDARLFRERSGRYHGRAQHKTADTVARCWFNVSRIGGSL